MRVRACSFRRRWKALAGSRVPGVKTGNLDAQLLGAPLLLADDDELDVEYGLEALEPESSISGFVCSDDEDAVDPLPSFGGPVRTGSAKSFESTNWFR